MDNLYWETPYKTTIECLLEINRPDLTCYLFAGSTSQVDWYRIAHFEQYDFNATTVVRSIRHHDIPERYPVKPKNTYFAETQRNVGSYAGASKVVRRPVGRQSTIVESHAYPDLRYMSQGLNLQALSLEDVALIEKAMRIGLSSCKVPYECSGCEETFRRCGLNHALTIDIMKVAK